MPLKAHQVESFLAAPPKDLAAVLFFGPGTTLVRERASALVRAALGPDPDPLLLIALSAGDLVSDPARLAGEAAQIPLFGGRRVIRIDGAGEGASAIFEEFLAAPQGDALVVVEAGDVKAKGALVRAFDGAKRAAAIACYEEDEESSAAWLESELKRQRLAAAPGILHEIVNRLGPGRAVLRSETEKLALYLDAREGAPKEVTLSALDAALAGGSADLDDLASAVVEGDLAETDRLAAQLLEAGTSPVTLLRAVANYVLRLHAIAAAVKAGADFDSAFRESGRFLPNRVKWTMQRQADKAAPAVLERTLAELLEAERLCKQTGYPEESLCHRALLACARLAPSRTRVPGYFSA